MYKITNCFDLVKEIFFPTTPKWDKLTFTKEAWMKLMCYINLVGEYEITGFGRVIDDEIVDIKILRQVVKSATVDCNIEAMQEFLMSIPKEEMGQWVLDWHSHVNMGVFASGTDTNNYEQQFKARCFMQYPVLIVNKKQEVYSKCYLSTARQTDIKIYIKQEEITPERFAEIYEECKSEVEEKCSHEKPKQTIQKTMFPYQSTTYANDYDSTDYYSRWKKEDAEYIDLSNVKKKTQKA